jgi:outer membrane protein assembly factor BamD
MPIVKGTEKDEIVHYKYVWSEYYMGDYILSQYHFKSFTRQFPTSPYIEMCAYMSAYCYYINSPNYKLDQTYSKNAIKEFQSFVDNFPTSSRIDSCNLLIDQLNLKIERKEYEIIKQYFKLEDWKATIVAVKNYLKEHPTSEYNDELYFCLIESYYLLAGNSIQAKKEERLNAVLENYVKFVDLYPKSSYLSRAESIYNNSKRLKEKINHE